MSLIHPCAANLARRKLPAVSAFLPDVTENPHPFKQEAQAIWFGLRTGMERRVWEEPGGVCVWGGHASSTQFENLTSGAPDREKEKSVSLCTIVSNHSIKDNPPTVSPFII